jgi:hypothetical protein
MCTKGRFPGVKRGRGVTLTIHPNPVPRSKMSRSYTFSPPLCMHGVLWDSFLLFSVISNFFNLYFSRVFCAACLRRSSCFNTSIEMSLAADFFTGFETLTYEHGSSDNTNI